MADGPEFKLLWKAQSTMVERGQQRITTALVHGHDVPKVWLVMGNLFQRYDQLENMLTDEGYEDMDFVGPLAEIERY
ncbi:MAG: hypothetical protein H6922_05065 [Pseudomonadaceae bacterium]|nr:hypothetical protein [Pseudomonadaceae bacterium]